MSGPGRVDVRMSTIRAAASLWYSISQCSIQRAPLFTHVTVDPLEPVLGSVAGGQVFQVVDNRDVLRLRGPQEVILNRIGASSRVNLLSNRVPELNSHLLVSKRNFDRTLKPMELPVTFSIAKLYVRRNPHLFWDARW